LSFASNEGNRLVYTLDAMGNRTREELRNAANAVITFRAREFDTLNRLRADVNALNQRTALDYDNQGNATRIDGPRTTVADITQPAYDALDRMTRITDAVSGVTSITFDALDAITRVTAPNGAATAFTRNAFGEIEQARAGHPCHALPADAKSSSPVSRALCNTRTSSMPSAVGW
jgi:YD repeat-containing protein